MRVMICAISRFSAPSGICRYASNLAACLADLPDVQTISMIVGAWQEPYYRKLLRVGGRVELVPVEIRNTSARRNLWFALDLPRLAQGRRCDILHCSFPIPLHPSPFTGHIVTTVHDMYPFDCPENFGVPAVWFNRAFFRQSLKSTDQVICISEHTAARLMAHFPEAAGKSSTIPNYVDFTGITPRMPERLGKSVQNPFFFCVAQHRKNKNLDLLIRAFAEVRRLQPSADGQRLLIVGNSGPETEKIESLARDLLPTDAVQFASGFLDEELAWLYQRCELFVAPSSNEGFCLPLLEAMHFGSRIVCSDITTHREIGSKNCTYFDLRSGQNALVSSILDCLASPAPKYGDALQKYSRRTISGSYLQIYKNLQTYKDLGKNLG